MSREAAGQLAQMMGNVVREGTGTAAALSGIDVAGKTGTAEVDNATANQAWFIGFAPLRESAHGGGRDDRAHPGPGRHGGGADRQAACSRA